MRLLSRKLRYRLTPPRLLLVSPLLAAALIGCYALMLMPGLVKLAVGWWMGVDLPAEPMLARPVHGTLLCIAAAVYGVARVLAFHPLYRKAYRQWLEQSPWSAGQRLPLGPVALNWRDALPLGVVALAAHFHAGIDPLAPLALFAFVYLGALAATLLATEAGAAAAAVFAALPAMMLLADRPGWALLAALLTYGVGALGLRRSLRAFPWRKADDHAPTGIPSRRQMAKLPLGWPLDRLAPKPPEAPASPAVSYGVPAMVGWWLYAIIVWATSEKHFNRPDYLGAFTILFFASAVLALFRLVAYAAGHRAPLSLAGRIATGRLLLPRYDRVFVAPACVLLVAAAAPAALAALHVHPAAAIALSAALVMATAFNVGPSHNAWHLTGAHHLTSLGSNTAGKSPDEVE